jgi:thiol-disulfide isomerase/thioredoxin
MPEQSMTPLSPADAERLRQAFQRCLDMEGTLGEQLEAYAAAGREIFPAYSEAVDRLVERIHENGGGDNAPLPGEPMPPFLLPDETGRMVAMQSLLADGPLAVMFFRGHWCPYCRLNIRAVIEAMSRIRAAGGQVVAIMPETQAFAGKFKADSAAPFRSSPISTTAIRCHSIWRSGSGRKSRSSCPTRTWRASMATKAGSCPSPRPSWSSRDGVVKARFVDPDFRKRMAVDDLIAALKTE